MPVGYWRNNLPAISNSQNHNLEAAACGIFAATACIFQEAGALVSDINGTPLDLNRQESTFMNHQGALYSSDAVLAEKIIKLYDKLKIGGL